MLFVFNYIRIHSCDTVWLYILLIFKRFLLYHIISYLIFIFHSFFQIRLYSTKLNHLFFVSYFCFVILYHIILNYFLLSLAVFSIAWEMLLHYVFELYAFIIDCLIVHESAHSTICNIGMRPSCRDAHSCCKYQSPISFGMQRHISCKLRPCLWPWFLVSPCDTAAQWTQRTAKANVQQADLAQGGEAAAIKFEVVNLCPHE